MFVQEQRIEFARFPQYESAIMMSSFLSPKQIGFSPDQSTLGPLPI